MRIVRASTPIESASSIAPVTTRWWLSREDAEVLAECVEDPIRTKYRSEAVDRADQPRSVRLVVVGVAEQQRRPDAHEVATERCV